MPADASTSYQMLTYERGPSAAMCATFNLLVFTHILSPNVGVHPRRLRRASDAGDVGCSAVLDSRLRILRSKPRLVEATKYLIQRRNEQLRHRVEVRRPDVLNVLVGIPIPHAIAQ